MRFSLALDDFRRLACTFADDQEEHTVFAADPPAAIASLLAALDDARTTGHGECFWLISAGEYRWVFRREGPSLRLAVLYVRSVAIGFQHVYWGSTEFDAFDALVRAEVDRLAVPSAS
jgi:hypothetical protein